jgi:hypothetical protein
LPVFFSTFFVSADTSCLQFVADRLCEPYPHHGFSTTFCTWPIFF